MARKIKVKVNAKTPYALEKYNYGTGFGWCSKREKKRTKRSANKIVVTN